MEQEYTIDEVRKHSTPSSAWIIYQGDVYDITEFIPLHPGGAILTHYLGQDVEQVWKNGGFARHLEDNTAHSILSKYKIGKLKKPVEPFIAFDLDILDMIDEVSQEVSEDTIDLEENSENRYLIIGVFIAVFLGLIIFVFAGISQ
jgi:cytochrome b involved in lipid metabolism